LAEEPGQTGVYKATPPEPTEGYWTGYYIEMYFLSDSGMAFKY